MWNKIGVENLKIYENLCPEYKSIFNECYKLKSDGKITKMWTFNGIVNIKYTDTIDEKPTKIFHIDDLDAELDDD